MHICVKSGMGWVVNAFSQKSQNRSSPFPKNLESKFPEFPHIASYRYGCGRLHDMDSYYEKEITRLHESLARIYRLGRLTPQEKIEADGIWARIERLTSTMVKVEVKERAQLALILAKKAERME